PVASQAGWRRFPRGLKWGAEAVGIAPWRAVVTGPSRRRATISQVAEEAQVARSTVSRAFTQPERLSAETVRRVLQVAERLGYTPNPVAQALSTGQSRNIALIVPDVANP